MPRRSRTLRDVMAPLLAIAFAAVAGVAGFLLFSPRAQEALGDMDRPWLPGTFCFATAVTLSYQLYRSTRQGYVYRGRTETVSKAQSRSAYRLWCAIHMLMIAATALLAAAFLRGSTRRG